MSTMTGRAYLDPGDAVMHRWARLCGYRPQVDALSP